MIQEDRTSYNERFYIDVERNFMPLKSETPIQCSYCKGPVSMIQVRHAPGCRYQPPHDPTKAARWRRDDPDYRRGLLDHLAQLAREWCRLDNQIKVEGGFHSDAASVPIIIDQAIAVDHDIQAIMRDHALEFNEEIG